MNLFTVLIPYLFVIVAFLLIKPVMALGRLVTEKAIPSIFRKSEMGAGVADKRRSGNHHQILWKPVFSFVFSGLFFMMLIYIFISIEMYFIRPNPSKNYLTEIKQSNVVIAFGFGIEKDPNGNLLAGQANDSIMKWISENSNANFIIAQKGCALSRFINAGTHVIEMHPHNDKVYVNTFEASIYALNKLDSLYKTGEIKNNKVLVVAHDMQLERAFWILKKMADKRKNAISYQFIVPNMPHIPFASNSSQIHTRNRFFYTAIELFISRPRDYFHSL